MVDIDPVMVLPRLLNESALPKRIYETAIRTEAKASDLKKAIEIGYRAIDTACTRKIHDE